MKSNVFRITLKSYTLCRNVQVLAVRMNPKLLGTVASEMLSLATSSSALGAQSSASVGEPLGSASTTSERAAQSKIATRTKKLPYSTVERIFPP